MLGVLKEERDDIEMVTNFSSLLCNLSNCVSCLVSITQGFTLLSLLFNEDISDE